MNRSSSSLGTSKSSSSASSDSSSFTSSDKYKSNNDNIVQPFDSIETATKLILVVILYSSRKCTQIESLR